MNKKILIGLGLVILLLPIFSNAADYYVAKDGSGDFSTIQAASNVAQPGDTIYIRAGTYRETIRPSRSGTSNNYITYARYGSEEVTITGVGDGVNLNSRHYIVIDGIRIENVGQWVDLQSSTHNIIKNSYMRGASGWSGIFMWQGSNHNKILYNTIIGTCTGSEEGADLIYCYGGCHYNVIEGNDVQYGSHMGIDVQGQSGDSSFNVIRNNRVWNPWHSGIGVYPRADYTLVEGNIILDSGEDKANNWCGSERDRAMDREDHAGIQLGSLNAIIRNNVLINNGCMEINSYRGIGTPQGPDADASDSRIYHNTFHKNNYGPYATSTLSVDGNVFKNNIFYKQLDYEIAMSMPSGTNYYINNNILGADYYSSPQGVWSGNLAVNPLFVNENAVSHTNNKNFNPEYVHLQSNSPMIDAGAFLTTTTNSGSNSRTIRVEDANYFYDGWEIEGEVGDLIQLQGSIQTTRITNVDYNTNTITIDRSLTWSSGQGVALAYNGNAPDIGAFEYGGSTPPTDCSGDCKSSPCSNFDNCFSASGSCSAGYYCCSGGCTTTTQTCTDGTPYSQCSSTKPLYCYNGNLINGCSTCGCPSSQTCQLDETCQGEPIPGLSWEAEDGVITSPFEISNGYIYQPLGLGCVGSPISSCGKASYTFNINNPGDYIVKAVVDAADTGTNSFFVNIDNEPTDPYMIWDIVDYTNGFEERTVSWRGDGTFDNNEFVPKIFTLNTGVHELIIRGREGRTLLDKITIEFYSGSITGDVNQDGDIDFNDLILVAADFGKTLGFNSRADTDNNGEIDIFDVVFVASRMT